MDTFIYNQLNNLKTRYKEIEKILNDLNITSNQEYFRLLSQEYSDLSSIIYYFEEWKKIQKDIKNITTLISDVEMREIAQEELKDVCERNVKIEKKLKVLLLPKNFDDNLNCYIEIRAATGGSEATLFAADLFRMYSRYAEEKNWKAVIISKNQNEYGGYKEIIIKIIGKKAYGHLKFESGGHRVQRIPTTESQGRVHTSTCTVGVFPEILEKDLPTLNCNDLKIDTFRSSGAGGQHVNTTDSAIRITHIPTGMVVECQDERSQHKNKSKALTVLRSRLHAAEKEKRATEKAEKRRNLLGTGERSDRSRTYNYPQGRITDHRINLTVYNLNAVMEGKLDLLITCLIKKYIAKQLNSDLKK